MERSELRGQRERECERESVVDLQERGIGEIAASFGADIGLGVRGGALGEAFFANLSRKGHSTTETAPKAKRSRDDDDDDDDDDDSDFEVVEMPSSSKKKTPAKVAKKSSTSEQANNSSAKPAGSSVSELISLNFVGCDGSKSAELGGRFTHEFPLSTLTLDEIRKVIRRVSGRKKQHSIGKLTNEATGKMITVRGLSSGATIRVSYKFAPNHYWTDRENGFLDGRNPYWGW